MSLIQKTKIWCNNAVSEGLEDSPFKSNNFHFMFLHKKVPEKSSRVILLFKHEQFMIQIYDPIQLLNRKSMLSWFLTELSQIFLVKCIS